MSINLDSSYIDPGNVEIDIEKLEVQKLYSPSKIHRILIKLANEMGYPDSSGGMCFGITLMGGAAILSQDVNGFNQRLKKIEEVFSQSAKNPVGELDSLNKNPNIRAFLEGVMALQDNQFSFSEPEHKKFFFEKPETKRNRFAFENIFPSIQSLELEKKGGVELAFECSLASTCYEMTKYIKTLVHHLEESQCSGSISIGTDNHVIGIGYDFFEKKIYMIDSNYLPIKEVDSIDEAVDALFISHSNFLKPTPYKDDELFVFGVRILTLKDHLKSVPEPFLFQVPKKDFICRLGCGDTAKKWLKMAIRLSDHRAVVRLLKLKPELCKVSLDDRPLISYAIFWQANQEIIQLLIESGGEVNKKNQSAPLLDAIWQNNAEAVQLLLNAGVDLDEKIFGLSYLEHALKKPNPEIIKLLENSKSEGDSKTQLQHSPRPDRLEEEEHQTIDETLHRVTERLSKF